ncbi:hypothetical protein BDV23DRAFT_156315 [Aspergillus alliaceus]|uniref:Uncharacterized protein n=1 Tax=Petromyces alliaceus TaxID=209559 RepID=A0A5N7C6Y6_PETAA|nr:hypothetical protein BDV23DRAFT_156315 [Aspergillus alliaceus]
MNFILPRISLLGLRYQCHHSGLFSCWCVGCCWTGYHLLFIAFLAWETCGVRTQSNQNQTRLLPLVSCTVSSGLTSPSLGP